ncbi:PREDICTED: IQ and ubiquitin-like domain-containing protein isoform X1 [Ficedula albicollis]|uniref:IQ and ubiquitin-like domain-containing protein isoform X1 n=1 Tax=Ficedula albicollis TaxID=59894 RepID=UPI000359CD73|nr:PREDICTED: IQ and ubiquitin-like domain-containing protein isoform X1 [Ficedula albicollis]XP_005039332.1 PREDICTED: IQ and ubiquitin-like domain-containing protein isoform X1 [Ficedula albicollis]XP_005039333.1 PREDICTED: IQ and ubiquitin-like domain-containing protein isoform X1 [Ficedula albicollis]XP_005039334.1 PREDICTED: IQ and ubiquitin-like domain-containing protein isoform X1 [Ficedula albicollis]XP_005039335.1 PREDICTED: IQ and ubiquitin-like domain-containing protein isoform X1 [F
MEGASDGFEAVASEGSGAEQSPASSQRGAGDPAEKPLPPEPARTAQSEKGWDRQSSQNSVLPKNTATGTQTAKRIEDNETLRKTRESPGKVIQQNYHMPDVVTVRVQRASILTGSDSFQEVDVKIERPTYSKPFLGGFRNVSTGVEFHNAGSQTKPPKRPHKGNQLFCKETQTAVEKNKQQQTRNTTSTQMTKIGLYVSNMTDKLITPGKYFTAEEYHKRRLEAVIVLQKYFRRWHAVNLVQNLKEQRRLRLAREAEEELQKKREKEEKLIREYEKKLNPKTKEDFELLYHELELWMREETERINRTLTGAERKAALCALLEEETQLIACIGMHKLDANLENQQKSILHLLRKCAQPRRWKAFDGKITEMDTQNTLRGKELLEIYRSLTKEDIPKDERTSVLLTVKYTVKEHECKLTQEIVALIDREIDLLSRDVKECNLEGLRKRICTLFLQYIKIPEFNPEVAGLLKVPQDPLTLYKKIYFCHSCENYLPSTEFPVAANSRTIGRCHSCYRLENEARQREAYLKYRLILEDLRKSEVDYQDDSKIVFLVQLPDMQYLIENIWNSQSALSASSDLYDLVMVRWDKQHEWSPWNTILLTKEEADVHLKLCNLQKTYEAPFIYKMEQKHIRAKNYFAQIPVMSSFLRRSNNQSNENSYKKHSSSKLKK